MPYPEQMHQTEQVPQGERVAQIEQPERKPQSEKVPQAEHVAQTEQAEQKPQAEHVSQTAQAEQMPQVEQMPQTEQVPQAEHMALPEQAEQQPLAEQQPHAQSVTNKLHEAKEQFANDVSQLKKNEAKTQLLYMKMGKWENMTKQSSLKHERLEKYADSLQRKQESLETRQKNLPIELELCREDIEKIRQDNERFKNENAELLAQLQAKRNELNQEKNSLLTSITNQQKVVQAVKRKKNLDFVQSTTGTQIQTLEKENSDLNQWLTQFKSDRARHESKLKQIQAEKDKAKAMNQQLLDEHKHVEDDKETVSQRIHQDSLKVAEEYSKMQQILQSVDASRPKLEEQVHYLNLQVRKLQNKAGGNIDRMNIRQQLMREKQNLWDQIMHLQTMFHH